MEDTQIIELYFARSEDAIAQTANKYGGYLRMIAGSILPGREDRDECVQDTYLRTWETIPPQRPQYFRAWLGCLTRTISISRWRALHAKKRGGGEYALSLDELGDCIPASDDTVQRYWYFRPVKQIARDCGVAEGSVKASLHRSRSVLRRMLEEEGIAL